MSPVTPDPDLPDPGPLGLIVEVARRAALAAASGILAGLACFVFLRALEWATDTRLAHPWLLWALPVAGLAVGGAYHLVGGRAGEGNALLLAEIHEPTAWVPRRMAPLVAVGTVVSHLFGASVGREGTALQMSGSLTDHLARLLGLGHRDRGWLLVAALAGGFGAVFGVPWAGAVFALEVQAVRRGHLTRLRRWFLRHDATTAPEPEGADLVHRLRRLAVLAGPALVAAFVGDAVVKALGYHHTARAHLHPAMDVALLGRSAAVGVAVGLAALVFVEATEAVRHVARHVPWPFVRPMIGGLAVLGLVAMVGRDDFGLSLPLIDQALAGQHASFAEPALKIAFTAICLGTGFVGGEVTPLYVIGATLGSAVAPALGLDPAVGAAVGYVGAFAGAANTPIACAVMGVELFGTGLALPLLATCGLSYVASGGRGIYATQRVHADGAIHRVADRPTLLHRASRTIRPASPTDPTGPPQP